MAFERDTILQCGKCLNTYVQAISGGECELSCCGEPLKVLKANTVDAAKEKHVPVIEKVEGGYKVKVGSVPHPMQADHWIMMIELVADNQVLRQYLNPGDAPEAVFLTKATTVFARELCNKHGVWRS